jgi:hypothetical protein
MPLTANQRQWTLISKINHREKVYNRKEAQKAQKTEELKATDGGRMAED